MRRFIAWTLPVLLLLGLVALALFVAVPNVESDIEAQADKVLADAGYSNIGTDVDGRNVRLTGLPEDREESRAIAQLVNDNVDGVRKVIVPGEASPTVSARPGDRIAKLLVEIDDNVRVSGTLANAEQIDRVTAIVRDLFGTDASIDLRTNPDFDDALIDRQIILAEPILKAASDGGLAEGSIEIIRRDDDGPGAFKLDIMGTARNEITRQAIVDAAGASGIPGSTNNLGIAQSISPLFTGEELEPELLRIKLLNLRYGASEIALTPDHLVELEALAELLAEYPTINVTVVGHRATIEGPARGERRGVVAFNELVRLGVSPQRLSLRDASDLEPVPGAADTFNARVTFEPVARSTS